MTEKHHSVAKEFFRHVEEIINKTDELAKVSYGVTNSSYLSSSKMQMKLLSELTESELIQANDLLKNDPKWMELPESIEDVIRRVKFATNTFSPQQLPTTTAQTGCSLGDCPKTPTQEQVDNILIAAASADLATAIAKLAADTTSIFFERAGKVLTAVASGLEVAVKGIELAAVILQRQVNLIAECVENAVNQMLLNMCNRINIIDHKVDNIIAKLELMDQKLDILLILVQSIKETVETILLLQIEEALSECKELITLVLPDRAFGLLEKVQEIVRKLIDYSKTAQIPSSNAVSYWKQGSTELENGNYEKALQWFMLSYRQLQRQDICKVPCPTKLCKNNTASSSKNN